MPVVPKRDLYDNEESEDSENAVIIAARPAHPTPLQADEKAKRPTGKNGGADS